MSLSRLFLFCLFWVNSCWASSEPIPFCKLLQDDSSEIMCALRHLKKNQSLFIKLIEEILQEYKTKCVQINSVEKGECYEEEDEKGSSKRKYLLSALLLLGIVIAIGVAVPLYRKLNSAVVEVPVHEVKVEREFVTVNSVSVPEQGIIISPITLKEIEGEAITLDPMTEPISMPVTEMRIASAALKEEPFLVTEMEAEVVHNAMRERLLAPLEIEPEVATPVPTQTIVLRGGIVTQMVQMFEAREIEVNLERERERGEFAAQMVSMPESRNLEQKVAENPVVVKSGKSSVSTWALVGSMIGLGSLIVGEAIWLGKNFSKIRGTFKSKINNRNYLGGFAQ